MQHCMWCGTELPANARFCGSCGRLQAAQPPAAQPEEVEEERRRAFLPGLPVAGNASLPDGQIPSIQGTPSIGQVPLVQGTSSMAGNAAFSQNTAAGNASLSRNAAASNAAFSRNAAAGNASPSQSATAATRPAQRGLQAEGRRLSRRTPQKGTHTPKQAAILGGKWIAIVIVIIVVVAASAGALVLAASHASSGQSGTQGNATSGVNSNSKGSSQSTGCPHPSAQSPCTGTTPTTSIPASHTADLTFSGVAAGHVVVPILSVCGPLAAGNGHGPSYGFSAIVTLGGKQYLFDLLAEPYTGPGTYSSVHRGQVQDYPLNSLKNTGTWGGSSGKMIIAGNSGSLDVTYTGVSSPSDSFSPAIPAPPGTFHVTGSWNCG